LSKCLKETPNLQTLFGFSPILKAEILFKYLVAGGESLPLNLVGSLLSPNPNVVVHIVFVLGSILKGMSNS